VLIFEYFTACEPAAPEFPEGQAMLETLVKSFLETGAHVSTITHIDCTSIGASIRAKPGGGSAVGTGGMSANDGGNTRYGFGAEKLSLINNPGWAFHCKRFNELFYDALSDCNAALVIAPEAEGILFELTARVERSGRTNLGSTTAGIAKAQNKFLTYTILSGKGIKMPHTQPVSDLLNIKNTANLIGYPIVIKPVDGTGSRGVYLVEKPGELEKAANIAMHAFRSTNKILLQAYIPGKHVSATMAGGSTATHPVSLNEQSFDGHKPFAYTGGIVCIDHPDTNRIFETATLAWDALGGLRGYGGVDLVISNNEIYVIEINPRPTTPLTALKKCLSNNLAKLLLQALRGEELNFVFKQTNLPFKVT